MKATLRTKKIKRKMRPSQMSRVQNQLKKNSKRTDLITVFIFIQSVLFVCATNHNKNNSLPLQLCTIQ